MNDKSRAVAICVTEFALARAVDPTSDDLSSVKLGEGNDVQCRQSV